MNQGIIGVDIGATKIHVGLVNNAKTVKEIKFPTMAGASKEDIIKNLIRGIESLEISDFHGIGIGVPGLIHEKDGIVYDLLNIPSWKEVHLKDSLESHFNKPVRITNDANVFALGMKVFGNGQKFKNLVGITMGTGFGAGIIINHKIYSGNYSSAGELGSIPYLDKTIEDYCSGKFFRNNYNLKGTEVFELAEKGDETALKIFEEFGEHLGNTIKLILFTYSPEAVFLGGSVNRSYKYFEKGLKKTLSTFPFSKVLEKIEIRSSHLENISILGAAALIVSEMSKEEEIIG